MNNSAEERREVAIKFGKGLMGEPFTSKAGKQLVEIKIPNPDPKDARSWETFVVPAGFVHENKFGNDNPGQSPRVSSSIWREAALP